MANKDPHVTTSILKKWKLAAAWLLLSIIGLVLLILERLLVIGHGGNGNVQHPDVLTYLPLKDLGLAFIIAVLIGIVYEWHVRRETLRELHEVLFDPKMIKNVLSREAAIAVVISGLQKILEDDQLGEDTYSVICGNFESSRRFDAVTDIILTPVNAASGTEGAEKYYYQARMSYEFKRVINAKEMVFSCVDSANAYNESYSNKNMEWRWEYLRSNFYPVFSEEFYTISDVTIDNQVLNVIKEAEANGDVNYKAVIPKSFLDGEMHRIKYVACVKLNRAGSFLRVDVRDPTKGLRVRFDYSRTDIRHIHIIEMLSSKSRPKQDRLHINNQPSKCVEVSLYNEWIIPQSGLAFVWSVAPGNVGDETKSK